MTTDRRQLLAGMGGALAGGLGPWASPLSAWAQPPAKPKARAKRLIFVVLNGGLSHVDSFDPKPALIKYAGKPVPPSALAAPAPGESKPGMPRPEEFLSRGVLQPSPWATRRYGQSGTELSELFPALGAMIDRCWLFRGMNTPAHQHAPALRQLVTGHAAPGHAAIGAWIAHVIAAEDQELPPFVALGTGAFCQGDELWGRGVLPAHCAGAYLPLDNPAAWRLARPRAASALQRAQAELLRGIDRDFPPITGVADPAATEERATREQRLREVAGPLFEGRARKGRAALDYGGSEFARGCRLACDLVEKGVRVVQLFSGADAAGQQAFDAHADLLQMEKPARQADQALAALVRDLEQRGLLDETLLVVATEFGRAPVVVKPAAGPWGRAHNPRGFSALMFGSRLKSGKVWGSTDELGLRAAEEVLAPQDLLVNILTRFRFSPEQVSVRHRGRLLAPIDPGSHIIRGLRLDPG